MIAEESCLRSSDNLAICIACQPQFYAKHFEKTLKLNLAKPELNDLECLKKEEKKMIRRVFIKNKQNSTSLMIFDAIYSNLPQGFEEETKILTKFTYQKKKKFIFTFSFKEFYSVNSTFFFNLEHMK